MDVSTQPVSANRLSVTHGLLIGGVSVALAIVFRVMDPLLQYKSFFIVILTIAITTTLLTVLGLDVRKKTGGYWSFGAALKSLILMTLISAAISTMYNFVLFKYVDPEMPVKVNEVVLESTTTMMTNMGSDETQIDKQTKPYKDGEYINRLQPTLINELKDYAIVVILLGIISLIVAACIKKKRPWLAPSEENTSN